MFYLPEIPLIHLKLKEPTMDAKPLGPNQPIKNTESQFNLVPINDITTGNILITVKLKIEQRITCQVTFKSRKAL